MSTIRITRRPGTTVTLGEGPTELEAQAIRRELDAAEEDPDPVRRLAARRALDRLASHRTHFTAGGI